MRKMEVNRRIHVYRTKTHKEKNIFLKIEKKNLIVSISTCIDFNSIEH